MYVCACVTSSTQGLRSAVVDNIRRRIVGVMFPPSIFEDRLSKIDDRCVDFQTSICRPSKIVCRPSKIDVTKCRPSEIDVSTFEDRCVDLRRSMCRLSKIDVSTFEDR